MAELVSQTQPPNNNVTEEPVSQNVILTNPITVEYSPSVIQTVSFLFGRFTIAAQKVFEIQHRVGNTSSGNGAGVASSYSVVEVFTNVMIWKVA